MLSDRSLGFEEHLSFVCLPNLSVGVFVLECQLQFHYKVNIRTMNIFNILFFFRVIVQASFSLFNLPLADIVDADLIKHKRRYVSRYCFFKNAVCLVTLW